MQQSYNCPNCQAPVAYGEPYCRNCGTPFTWEPPQSYDQQQYNGQQDWEQQQDWGQQQEWRQQQQPPVPPLWNQQAWGQPDQYQQQYGAATHDSQTKKKPLNRTNLIFGIIAAIVVLGGIGYGVTQLLPSQTTELPPEEEPTVTATAPSELIQISFSISPTTVERGQSATLTWNVSGAKEISIDQGIGKVSANGTKSVIPTESLTTYELEASNDTEYKSQTVTVTINEPAVPVIKNFSAIPAAISSGQTSLLQWSVTGATSIIIDHDIGVVSASGSRDMNPTETTTYTLTATNTEGSVTKSFTITVGTGGAPQIVSFTASPTNIDPSEASMLSWNVTGATSVSLGGTRVNSSGQTEVFPTYSTTYNLTASNNIGTVTAKAVVTVSGTDVVKINSFYPANNIFSTSGDTITLYWDVFGATSITITQDATTTVETTTSPSGNTTATLPSSSSTFILTATNASSGQTVTSSPITITKVTASLPEIFYFTANDIANAITIGSGTEVTLEWDVSGNTETVTITPSGQCNPTQFQKNCTVYPTTNTQYKLTATNSAGYVDATINITVSTQ